MTKEALKLALEALEYRGVGSWRKKQPAIAAIKQALANDALEKKAENARELGLDYEPQRTWVGLTDEEVESLQRLAIDPVDANGWGFLNRERFAYLIEIKLKAKNT